MTVTGNSNNVHYPNKSGVKDKTGRVDVRANHQRQGRVVNAETAMATVHVKSM